MRLNTCAREEVGHGDTLNLRPRIWRTCRGSYFERKGPRQQGRGEDRYKEAPHLTTAASIGAWKGNFPKYE